MSAEAGAEPKEEDMRKIVVAAFVSLDGVMQAPGGPEEDPTGGFKYGGWTVPYWHDAIGAVLGETFSKPFDLLLGRKTYDIFAAYWPNYETDSSASSIDEVSTQVARSFNAATKYVATHSPETLSWKNSRSLGSDVVATLREVKQGEGPVLLIQGSSNLIQTLLAHDLIDEFRLLVYPLVLGNGKRLFGDGTTPAAFRLTKSATMPNGVISANFERAGAVQTGSFAAETPSPAEVERRSKMK
jgi:dihydrofolate reductase